MQSTPLPARWAAGGTWLALSSESRRMSLEAADVTSASGPAERRRTTGRIPRHLRNSVLFSADPVTRDIREVATAQVTFPSTGRLRMSFTKFGMTPRFLALLMYLSSVRNCERVSHAT